MSVKSHREKQARTHRNPEGRGRGRKDREIARLQNELRTERRRRAKLEREVADLRRQLRENPCNEREKPLLRLADRNRSAHRQEQLLDAASRRAQSYRKSSFFRYLWESVTEWMPVRILSSLLLYLRRIRVIRILLSTALALGLVAAVTALSAVVLPFLLLGAGTLTILAFLRARHMNAILHSELSGKHIRILIPPRGSSLSPNSFFIRNARAMASEPDAAVLVVSPYLISRRGLGGHGGFFTARREGEGLFLSRRHYFFFLRRQVLDRMAGDITVVY